MDGADNMIKVVDLAFDKIRHIICFTHTINNVAQQATSNAIELTTLITKVKIIIKWFKQSVIASDELRKSNNGERKLLKGVPTRWNSTFYMLQQFISLIEIVNNII